MSTPTTTLPATCTTAVPDAQGYVPPASCNAHYGFYPSWQANLFFAVAFFLSGGAHVAQLLAHKKPVCWVLVTGAVWEHVCFVLRTAGAFNQQDGGLVAGAAVLFLLAPVWINAFVYMVVARLIHFLLPPRQQRVLGLKPRWLAEVFVAGDVVSFFIQAAGGGMLAGQEGGETVEMGQRIYMAGIGVQLAFVVLFVVVLVVFARRLERLIRAGLWEVRCDASLVKPLMWSLMAVIALIVVRIVFRFVEFSGGVSASNPILAHEAYQLCLDALPMLIALLVINFMHPGKVLRGPESSFPKAWRWCWKGKFAESRGAHEVSSSSVELNSHPNAEEDRVNA